MTPRVVAVSLSPKHGFSKVPQEFIRLIAGEGVEGDAHRGQTTQHLYRMRQDPTQPNLCQVHLLSLEKLEDLRSNGFAVHPGQLGENVLTAGVDLLNLPLATLLRVGNEALLKVTGLRTPCPLIDKYQRGLQKHMWGERDERGRKTRRAGIMSIVVQGGSVRSNDAIVVELPPGPHLPLPAV